MQKVKVTVNYKVPSWDFCNDDRLDGGKLTKHKCRFCVAEKGSYKCMLYDKSLFADNSLVRKTHECKLACVGVPTEVVEPEAEPAVPPKELMKMAIDAYTKNMKDLLNQGYPRAIAENVARQLTLK